MSERRDADEVDLEEIDSSRMKTYWRRVKNDKCPQCGRKLDPDYPFRACPKCKRKGDKNWKEFNLRQIQKEISNMPDYLKKQFYKGLEDLSKIDPEERK